MNLIWVKTYVWIYLSSYSREIENVSYKSQRNEIQQYKQRIQIECSQNRIYKISINAIVFKIGFLEVIGNAIYTDITKLNEDTKKVLKCMQISFFYQCQHHLQYGVKEQLLNFLESYEIIVYSKYKT